MFEFSLKKRLQKNNCTKTFQSTFGLVLYATTSRNFWKTYLEKGQLLKTSELLSKLLGVNGVLLYLPIPTQ